jgi:hypothetical protein
MGRTEVHTGLGGGEFKERTTWKTRHRWKDNIENVRHGLIHLAEDWDKWQACEHGNEPSGSIKCGEFPD